MVGCPWHSSPGSRVDPGSGRTLSSTPSPPQSSSRLASRLGRGLHRHKRRPDPSGRRANRGTPGLPRRHCDPGSSPFSIPALPWRGAAYPTHESVSRPARVSPGRSGNHRPIDRRAVSNLDFHHRHRPLRAGTLELRVPGIWGAGGPILWTGGVVRPCRSHPRLSTSPSWPMRS